MSFTLQRKLMCLGALAGGLLVAIACIGFVAADTLIGSSRQLLLDGSALKHQMHADMAHDALRGDVLSALLAGSSAAKDAQREKDIRGDLQKHSSDFRSALEAVESMQLDARVAKSIQQLRPALDAYVARATEIVGLSFADPIAAMAKMEDFMFAFRDVEREMAALSEILAEGSRATHQRADAQAAQARALIGGSVALAVPLLLAICWWVSRSVARRITAAVGVARTVATGDLRSRIEVTGSDEAAQLLQALAQMNASLVNLVSTVRESSDHIATGTVQIANGNQDLSERTEQQAGNLQQTAASMEQISAIVRANADSTRKASDMAVTASRSAAASGEAVAQLVATMGGISEASRRITDIIGVIDGIAFQTNILALNAAVEAARAGDQGRGFAVVAAEVRSLAQRSAGAAKEIKQLIETSTAQVGAGERQAAHAGERMGEVVLQVQEMTRVIASINTATDEETKGIAEVSQAVNQIDRATQSNASLVEEAAAAAESLNQQAARLVEAVSAFRVDAEPRLLGA